MTALTVKDLSNSSVNGTGTFDVLMRAMKEHLEQEFKAGRIKGPEYSTVYLGAMNQVMEAALSFLLQRDKVNREISLLDKRLILADLENDKARTELQILQATRDKIPKEVLQLEAQTALIGQQRTNLVSEELGIVARTALTNQQKLNAVTEGEVLVIQKGKLNAEKLLTEASTQKATSERLLLDQKTATERAQVLADGVDDNSVIGRQKTLYKAQTDGFLRDAEQKAAKIFTDTWSVRRTTDEGTVADSTNMLDDATVGRAMKQLLIGVGA